MTIYVIHHHQSRGPLNILILQLWYLSCRTREDAPSAWTQEANGTLSRFTTKKQWQCPLQSSSTPCVSPCLRIKLSPNLIEIFSLYYWSRMEIAMEDSVLCTTCFQLVKSAKEHRETEGHRSFRYPIDGELNVTCLACNNIFNYFSVRQSFTKICHITLSDFILQCD